MSLLSRFRKRDAVSADRIEPPVQAAETSGTMNPEGWLVDGWGGAQSRVKTLPRVTPENAQRHATVFACGNIIAGDLAKLPLNVMQKDRKSGRLVQV